MMLLTRQARFGVDDLQRAIDASLADIHNQADPGLQEALSRSLITAKEESDTQSALQASLAQLPNLYHTEDPIVLVNVFMNGRQDLGGISPGAQTHLPFTVTAHGVYATNLNIVFVKEVECSPVSGLSRTGVQAHDFNSGHDYQLIIHHGIIGVVEEVD